MIVRGRPLVRNTAAAAAMLTLCGIVQPAPALAAEPDAAWSSVLTRQSGPAAGAVRSYLGSGSAAENPWAGAPTQSAPRFAFGSAYLLADVTGDPRDDLLVVHPTVDNGTLYVYPNIGEGDQVRWGERYPAGTGWNDVDNVGAYDVTQDGRVDLIAREPGEARGTLRVYVNNGSREANPFTSVIWAGTGWNLATDLHVGEFTGDGEPDVLVRNDLGRLVVYRGNGSSDSNPWTTASVGADPAAVPDSSSLLTADVDSDGLTDLLVRSDDGGLEIRRNTGTPGAAFSEPAVPAGDGWNQVLLPVPGDVNADGAVDLAAVVPTGADLVVYPNSRSDTGSPVDAPERYDAVLAGATLLRSADLDGDGRRDLLLVEPARLGGRLVALLDDGSGSAFPWTVRVQLSTAWSAYTETLAGDLDGDGRGDVLAVDGSGRLWLYRTVVAGDSVELAGRMPIGSGFADARTALGDVDGDGIDDLVALHTDGRLALYTAAGAGEPPIGVPGDFSSTRALALGPVDGTGRDCLLVVDDAGVMWMYPNSGGDGNPFTLGRRSAGPGWDAALDVAA